MFSQLPHNFPHYFRKRFTKQLEELYLSVAILDFALAAVVLFEPIYLYQQGFGVPSIMLYYVVVYGLYFFLVPLGGKFVARFGAERSMLVASVMMIGYYGSLFLIQTSAVFFWVAPIFFALQKMFYWPAYHSDFIRSSDEGERGKEFSGLWSVSTIVYILGPIVGGLLITRFGFNGLFVFVGAVVMLSNIPLFLAKVPREKEKFSYWHALTMPFHPIHRRSALAYVALGEELIMLTVWPIFIFLMFKDYLSIGGILTGATLLTALVTLLFGRAVDQGKPHHLLRIGGVMTALVWITRLAVNSTPAVFISDTLGRIFKNSTFVPLTSMTYERALKERRVIERSVFYEQGFAIGKTLAALAVFIIAHFVSPFTAAWVLAAFVSLFYLLFR